LLTWEPRLLEQCERHHSRRNLPTFTSQNIVITESYAGTCAGSFALGRAFDHAKKCCGHDGRRWRVHFACDKGDVQQDLLTSMSGPHQPQHIFGDILDRLHDDDRTYLDHIVNTTFAANAVILQQAKQGEITFDNYKDAAQSLCDDMYTSICNRLEKATFRLAWAYSTRYYGPDAIQQECVPGFNADLLLNILSPKYTAKFMEFAPCDAGFPSSGKRQFGIFVLANMVKSQLEAVSSDLRETFKKCINQPNSLDMILQGSQELQDACMASILERNSLFGIQVGYAKWEDVLTPHERKRLTFAKRNAADSGYCQIDDAGNCFDWSVSAAIVNLDVTEGFDTTRISRMPRLTKGSLLWDLVRERLLVPEEYWIAMGWPVPGVVPKSAIRCYPHDLNAVSFSHHRMLMGNGMHVVSMGCVSYWMMSAPTWRLNPRAR
ncbi:unnamed protein product, partial [Prorocentrum cordatum]